MQAPPPAGAAFDAFLRDTAPASRQRRPWTPADGPVPALYLSHGAPPLFDDARWIQELFAWALTYPTPDAGALAAPVLQLSMPTHDPERLLDIGRRLRPLRQEGVLVIGSGF